MDENMMKMVGKIVWFVTGLSALCVGLNAMGIDLVGMVGLSDFDTIVHYVVGACGAASLAMLVMKCNEKCTGWWGC